ncbi:MAG: hypothetical protein V3T45_03275 [Nitrospinaceae bacterium]
MIESEFDSKNFNFPAHHTFFYGDAPRTIPPSVPLDPTGYTHRIMPRNC